MSSHITRPLQNAEVMAREKQGEAAEKVMFMRRNPFSLSLTMGLSVSQRLLKQHMGKTK